MPVIFDKFTFHHLIWRFKFPCLKFRSWSSPATHNFGFTWNYSAWNGTHHQLSHILCLVSSGNFSSSITRMTGVFYSFSYFNIYNLFGDCLTMPLFTNTGIPGCVRRNNTYIMYRDVSWCKCFVIFMWSIVVDSWVNVKCQLRDRDYITA